MIYFTDRFYILVSNRPGINSTDAIKRVISTIKENNKFLIFLNTGLVKNMNTNLALREK